RRVGAGLSARAPAPLSAGARPLRRGPGPLRCPGPGSRRARVRRAAPCGRGPGPRRAGARGATGSSREGQEGQGAAGAHRGAPVRAPETAWVTLKGAVKRWTGAWVALWDAREQPTAQALLRIGLAAVLLSDLLVIAWLDLV